MFLHLFSLWLRQKVANLNCILQHVVVHFLSLSSLLVPLASGAGSLGLSSVPSSDFSSPFVCIMATNLLLHIGKSCAFNLKGSSVTVCWPILVLAGKTVVKRKGTKQKRVIKFRNKLVFFLEIDFFI